MGSNDALQIVVAINWASEASPTLGCMCSIEISRDIYRYVGLSMGNHTKITYVKKCVGEITWPKHAHAQSLFWAVKTEQTELQKSKNRGKKGWIKPEHKKTENLEKQRLATLKRLKRGDDNEF